MECLAAEKGAGGALGGTLLFGWCNRVLDANGIPAERFGFCSGTGGAVLVHGGAATGRR